MSGITYGKVSPLVSVIRFPPDRTRLIRVKYIASLRGCWENDGGGTGQEKRE